MLDRILLLAAPALCRRVAATFAAVTWATALAQPVPAAPSPSDEGKRDHRLIAPLPESPPAVPETRYGSENPIDHFLAARWNEARRRPAELSSDDHFVRRIYLDLAGRIPTAEQIEGFRGQPRRTRRTALIDALLDSDRYAAHWGIFWEDLLRVRSNMPGTEPNSFRQYVQTVLRENKPYDQWVREMITAEGTTREEPAANFIIRHRGDKNELTITVTQVFLGLRLKCVQCHDDRMGRFWKQKDFIGLADYFSALTMSRVDETVVTLPNGNKQRRYSFEVFDRYDPEGTFLGGEKAAVAAGRAELAELVAGRSNPYFARVAVNRIWAQLMGAGIVDPVDDFDVINEPSHPELLDWLAIDFVNSGYDLKHAIRRIVTSRAYQLASRSFRRVGQKKEERLFNAMPLRRLTAEQLYDSILVCCGIEAAADEPGSAGWRRRNGPRGPRRPWDQRRPAIETPYPPPPASFLRTFGSHDRDTIHPRDPEATIPQALELMNGDFVNRAISWHENNPVRQWSEQGLGLDEAFDKVFRQTLSREPTPDERRTLRKYFAGSQTPEQWSDLLWALINTREFMFVH